MKLIVKVIPNSKENKVLGDKDGSIKVKLTAPAKEGKANKALIELLSDYFNIPKSSIFIISGSSSKTKIVDILK